jgi:hypothetical protein
MFKKTKQFGVYEITIQSCEVDKKSLIEIKLNGMIVYHKEYNFHLESSILEMAAIDEIHKIAEKNQTIDEWLSVFSV